MTHSIPSSNHRYRLPGLQAKLIATNHQQSPAGFDKANQTKLAKKIAKYSIGSSIVAGFIFVLAIWIGDHIALGGNSKSTNRLSIIIGKDVVMLPENMVRYRAQRQVNEANKLDLYLAWPTMQGYTEALRTQFNTTPISPNIVFLTFEHRFSNLSMAQRVSAIYEKFSAKQPSWQLGQLAGFELKPEIGFLDEEMVIANDPGTEFAARCSRAQTTKTLPYCITDIPVGTNLTLTYRFHRKLLPRWKQLSAKIYDKARSFIR